MDYRVGSIGRVVVAKFSDSEDLLKGIKDICIKENIRGAVFFLIGGLKKGEFVVGPETEQMPPKPIWRELRESHEVLGIGTVFWEADEPKIHLHSAYGKRDSVKVGCLRKYSEVFLIIEAIILEVTGISAERIMDPKSGLSLLQFT
jgi:predicted DNA-binding protein with PD1-like motif